MQRVRDSRPTVPNRSAPVPVPYDVAGIFIAVFNAHRYLRVAGWCMTGVAVVTALVTLLVPSAGTWGAYLAVGCSLARW